jgi:predicted metal-dependent phosphoesterase TrpH
MTIVDLQRVDLHTHSLYSDGTLSPADLVTEAVRRNVQLLALTDHDTIGGCSAAQSACRQNGICFVNGVELTCEWLGREIHVVGLGIDPQSATLTAQMQAVREQRVERLRRIGIRLDAAGLEGTAMVATILLAGETATRMHLARALVSGGKATDTQQAFDRWLTRGQAGYVAADWPKLETAVASICHSGGLPVLAHAHRYKVSNGQLRQLCAEFKAAGGIGIEVSLAGQSIADYERLASLARRFELLASIASDFHEPGIPWRPLGRLVKLPDGLKPVHDELLRRVA